ncbi:TIGR04206 family protein [Haloplanus sp. GCM10025708]|uniref:TIGR04206 family protein n=1 Tax=Haloferacaceae TaxID=1644056 RepID=UPI00361D71FF
MSRSPRRAVVALFALLAVPWTALVYESGYVTLVFPWGLATPAQGSVTSLYHFLFRYTAGLPEFILAWPLGVLCYVLALASAVAGVVTGREDVRVTAGLLVFAGVAGLSVASGFSVQPGRVAYPVGTLVLWAVAWWFYRPLVCDA